MSVCLCCSKTESPNSNLVECWTPYNNEKVCCPKETFRHSETIIQRKQGSSGSEKSIQWCEKQNGKMHGPYIYLNGPVVIHENYKDGKLHGLSKQFFKRDIYLENKKYSIISKSNYINSQFNGLAEYWYGGYTFGQMRNNKKEGIWKSYYRQFDHYILVTKIYENDITIKETETIIEDPVLYFSSKLEYLIYELGVPIPKILKKTNWPEFNLPTSNTNRQDNYKEEF